MSDEQTSYDQVDAHSAYVNGLEARLESARSLLLESVEHYPKETNSSLWTSRVRKWLEED
jgi:hypothetical protein